MNLIPTTNKQTKPYNYSNQEEQPNPEAAALRKWSGLQQQGAIFTCTFHLINRTITQLLLNPNLYLDIHDLLESHDSAPVVLLQDNESAAVTPRKRYGIASRPTSSVEIGRKFVLNIGM